jgi:Zn-dependent peptidase ImmA (M78 family)
MAVPTANKGSAEAEAIRLWRTYGFGSPRDLVLEDLALSMGVVIIEGPLDSADARLVRRGKRGLIRIRESIPEASRKRFAAAHEIGHWVLHKAFSQLLACTSEDMVSLYKASPPEVEASHFASALLMPEALFARRIEGTVPTAKVLSALADEFQTSLTATAARYVELRNDYCALVVSEGGKVRWWRASPDFDRRFWIDHGSRLSQRTLASTVFRTGTSPRRPEKVDIDAWLPGAESKGIHSDFIFEEAIPILKYNQVLSLLWLP